MRRTVIKSCDGIGVPRVSVIVPAYNASRFVGGALDSVVAQRFTDWEVVVADDGSTDETSAVVQAREDTRIRLVRSPVNRGLAATRNLAVEHARGELVALLDADDTWLPEYLELQVGLFDRAQRDGGTVGIVCCDAYLIQDGQRLAQTYGDRFGRPAAELTIETVLQANPIFVSVLAPRALIREAGGFDPSLRSVEDLDLWVRLMERGARVVYQPRPLVQYRLAAGTLSTDTLTMARSRQVVLRRALDRGNLPPAARRQAGRSLRLQRAVEQVELLRRDWRGAPRSAIARFARALPLFCRAAVERRWAR
jgi:glycosyltransferase involved in cell wall biosynthesis